MYRHPLHWLVRRNNSELQFNILVSTHFYISSSSTKKWTLSVDLPHRAGRNFMTLNKNLKSENNICITVSCGVNLFWTSKQHKIAGGEIRRPWYSSFKVVAWWWSAAILTSLLLFTYFSDWLPTKFVFGKHYLFVGQFKVFALVSSFTSFRSTGLEITSTHLERILHVGQGQDFLDNHCSNRTNASTWIRFSLHCHFSLLASVAIF